MGTATVRPWTRARRFDLPLSEVRLHVREWGPGDADVTIVLAHGWSLSSRIWEDVAALVVMADPQVRVIAYDHRGHGDSTAAPASIDVLADDLAAIVAALVPTGPIVFGGHSLGGMTLMALAERHPDIVARRASAVALVATSAGDLLGAIRRVPGMTRVLKLATWALSRVSAPSSPLFLVRQGARGAFGARPRRYDMNRAVRQTAQANPQTVASLGRSLLDHDRYHALGAFAETDVVIMAGTRDLLTSPAHTRRIAARLPRSKVVVYDKAGHFLPYERRESVAAHVLDLAANARILLSPVAEAAG